MNRVLRRTILKTLFEQAAGEGLLSGYELLTYAPKNLSVSIDELRATCGELRRRDRIEMHGLSGVAGVFVMSLTPRGRRAYEELETQNALALDILWILRAIDRGELKLQWGWRGAGLVDDVTPTLGQLLQTRDAKAIRQAFSVLEGRGEVQVVRDPRGCCVELGITPAGLVSLRESLAGLNQPPATA